MPEPTINSSRLSAKLALEKKTAKQERTIRVRVASAWTLANTMLPAGTPDSERYKFAHNLLKNSTPTLKLMVQTAATNTYHTRLAEAFKEVHKVELNEFLDDPSVLTKEENAVESELKGDAKNAGKVAHGKDCKGCDKCDNGKEKTADMHENVGLTGAEDGGLLANLKKVLYGLDGSYTKPELLGFIRETLNGKKTSGKKAGMEDAALTGAEDSGPLAMLKKVLYGLDGTYTKLEIFNICKDTLNGKSASVKKADDTKDAGPQPAEYPEPKREEPADLDGNNAAKREADTIDKSAKNKKAEGEEAAPAPEAEPMPVEGAEDAMPAEATEDGDIPEDALNEDVAPVEEFDEQEASLEDAIDDTKDAIDNLQEALDEKEKEDDVILPEGEGEGDFTEEDFEGEAEPGEEDFVDEEFDITRAFEPGTIEDKVSSLANEDITAAYGDDGAELMEEEMGEDFFGPSTPGELEGILDQEESLSSPADMFAGDAMEDPLAALFASTSTKRAGAEDEIVKPGELDDFFETSLAGDDRDGETDHEDDILFEVTKNEKPVDQGSERTKSDQEPQLEEPKNAGKKPLRLAPRDPRKVAARANDIVSALWGNE